MKRAHALVVLLSFCGSWISAQVPPPLHTPAKGPPSAIGSSPQIIRQETHRRDWQQTIVETDLAGKSHPSLHHFVELAPAMNRYENGKWAASSDSVHRDAAGLGGKIGSF